MKPSRCRRCLLWVLGAACLPPVARADTRSLQFSDLAINPYMLLQLDEGGTFAQDQGDGEGTGFNPRRARLGAEGTIADELAFGFVWDFGGTPGDHSHLFEADIAYTGLDPFIVRAGVFKPDFTLEYAQSAADILFLERASIVNIVGGLVAGAGRVGGQVGASNDRWFAAAWLTGGQTGPGAQGGQRAVLGRIAGLLIKPMTSHCISVHQALGYTTWPAVKMANIT